MSGYEEAFGSDGAAPEAAVDTPAVAEGAPPQSEAEPTPAPAQAEPQTPPAETPAPSAPSGRDRDIAGLIKALQDERDQTKAAREEAARLKAWRDEQERKAAEAAAQVPDPLEHPEDFVGYFKNEIATLNKTFDARLQSELTKQRASFSARAWKKELGPENWKKLNEWVASNWSDQHHRHAMLQEDPYGFAWEKFQEIERGKRVKTIEEKLSGKDLDAYIAEQVAAKLAEAQAQPAQPGAPAQPDRPRNPDGTFASPSQPQQRHQPPSLATVNGAPAPRGSEVRSGYDAAFRK